MINYKEFYSNLNGDYNIEKHIIGLLNMGFTADEIGDVLKIEDEIIVTAINNFAEEEMNKIKFNGLMEKLGVDYEYEEKKNFFG